MIGRDETPANFVRMINLGNGDAARRIAAGNTEAQAPTLRGMWRCLVLKIDLGLRFCVSGEPN